MELTSPSGQILYKDVKKQYDTFTWTSDQSGVYKFCFSNEFSTFSHKVVYFDFQVGDEKPLVEGDNQHATAMTMDKTMDKQTINGLLLDLKDQDHISIVKLYVQIKQLQDNNKALLNGDLIDNMETSAVNLHEDLKTVIDYQTHHRLREAQGRVFAEDLNERVFYWSLGQSLIILTIGIGQVLVLRSFFTDKRGNKP
ncbi:hypothetical protein KUTeg_010744 [Tegillarca granosa]|uniref:GOLD domain-containing protein n=1 Tax=Tegillarca granosa TaxID=220873 RepID=A0ABQ9F1X1_TEGGR|nr:hypothetical protein KUTeg_010744 [Tegillarca granosa]